LQLTSDNGVARIACDEDLILYVPRQASLEIQLISGDASFQALHGPVRTGPIAGDLTMHDVGPVNFETGTFYFQGEPQVVQADFRARGMGILVAAFLLAVWAPVIQRLARD